uniref:TIR domain-containing protein n=1 Tax=Salix viminalis TaxID=40686 RepID=A0A6N2LTI3_SALVM
MQKEKRKHSKDEEDDSSSRKRRKADLSKPVSFISTEPKLSRSRPKGAYDVFLSFRGEDNRKSFTGHLYTALVQAGVHTFLDENEIPRGEEISKHLLKAIQESKISIVIFSKGYASTRWCLNELVEILECKNRKTGHIVLPIFYDIDPSDVRKQTGSFAKAFDKHEECLKEKVKEWRKALEEVGNLSGWNLNDMENRHESKLIQVIIKDVLNKLDPKYINVATNLVGIDRLVQTISDILSTTTDEVCMVGLHGMSGIGKTTIAKVVFNQLCYGFEGSCFLSNINETSEQPNGLAHLQEQLLHDILKQNVATINNADRGMVLIKERLCHKRVIVVVDDVANQYQLNALVGERSWFGPGSRVIITTKDERLLLKVDRKFKVEELKREVSLQLFSWHAFKDNKPSKDYVGLSNDVVDYCGGIPLALEVLGSSLSAKNKSRWKCVIDKLRIIPNHDIQEKLRICFDTLDDHKLQKTFLDLACFFIGRNKEYVSHVLEARCGYNPEDDLGTLGERSLIKVNASGEISMHNLLRDMGREIIHKESLDHPGKRSRIWQCEDAWNVLSKQMGTEVVEGLSLDVRASKNKLLSTRSFTKMRFLKLLQINGVHLSGPFKLLSEELIWICWLECPLKSFPSDLMVYNLVVLEMQSSNIKELWKEQKCRNSPATAPARCCNPQPSAIYSHTTCISAPCKCPANATGQASRPSAKFRGEQPHAMCMTKVAAFPYKYVVRSSARKGPASITVDHPHPLSTPPRHYLRLLHQPHQLSHLLRRRKPSSPDASKHSPSPSDPISGHHRPPFLTPPRPEEPPRRPLPKGVNRYASHRTRKFTNLLFIFFFAFACGGVKLIHFPQVSWPGFVPGLIFESPDQVERAGSPSRESGPITSGLKAQ